MDNKKNLFDDCSFHTDCGCSTENRSVKNWSNLLHDTPSKHFCIAPFQSIRQNAFGRNSPCAFGAGDWHHGHLTPEQRWHSPELNQLRQEFIQGERPAACSRCWDEEDAGKISLRQRQYEYFPDDYKQFILSGRWLNGPKTAVFKVSNVCNLACRSCAGWDSNTFASEGQYYQSQYNTTIKVSGESKLHNRFIPLAQPKHVDFSQYLKIADNLEKIDFYGGEPFLNVSQLVLLEYLIQRGLSKNITLYYSTNCTNHPTDRLKRAWSHFRRVEIAVSIDGLQKEFEYMRWPAQWDYMLEVLSHIKSLQHQLKCQVFVMGSATLSIMNAWSADKLTSWMQKNIGPYYVNMVHSPEYLAVHIAPDHVKQAVLAHVTNQDLRNYMQLKPHHPDLWRQFIIWMKRQDAYRGENFKQVFPEYQTCFSRDWDDVTDLSEQNFHRQTVVKDHIL